MSVTFRANIRWPENDLLFPADWFGVRPPPGLDLSHVRAPKYLQMLEMQKRLRSSAVRSGSSGTLATVDGLVDTDLTVRYADVAAQWRRLPSPDGKPSTRGPGRFQFTGGEVILDLRIGLFLVSFIEPDLDDDLSLKIFAAHYGHELLHVLDETDVVKNWLPPKALADPFVDKMLGKQEPFIYGTPSQTISEVEKEFRERITAMTHDNIRNGLWAPEVNRREAIRDSAAEYKKVQDVVDALRAAQVNRKR
jgi:hypothetical protein